MALRRGLNAAAGFRILFAILTLIHLSTSFQTVPGSSCASVCSGGTLSRDAVCIDAAYKSTEGGQRLQSCVGCLLNSTAVDTGKNETDVEFGLLALRFTLSTCMFGIPEERVSISSPCQVTCTPLNVSIAYQLDNTSAPMDPSTSFCTAGQFDDITINNCAFCYSFIPQQLFLANFLQALHITCRVPPAAGQPFFPNANTIFNETLIAGPSPPSSSTGGRGGLHGSVLAIVIALPIVGGILLISGLCWCCWVFTRKRRRRMAASGRMERVKEQEIALHSPIEGKNMWGDAEPPREMSQLSPNGRGLSPGTANARWSQHYPPGTAMGGQEEDGTPLRHSFQHSDVGPGTGQIQDPDLHEQYFGVADGGEDLPSNLPGPSGTRGLGLYDQIRAESTSIGAVRDGERGHWS